MKNFRKLTLAAAAMLLTVFAFAQANNLVVFSQDGYKFTLIVNGLRQNEKPETNVKVTGLTATNYKVRILFADANFAPIDQNIYMQWGGEDLKGKELSCSIENTKKGLKLRPNSVAELNTNTAPDQVVYLFNPSGNATQTGGYSTTTTTTTTGSTTTTTGGPAETVNMNVNMGGTPAGSTTTTTVNDGTGGTSSTTTTTTTTTGTTDNVNVGMTTPGGTVGISINVNDGMGGTTTSSSTTTTTTSSTTTTGGTTSTVTAPPPSNQCIYPMSSSDFANAKSSISKQSFSEEKMKVAKQVLNSNCMSTAQVKEIMSMFSMEDDKLAWAKYAYGKTTDPQNFYQLNDAFSFSSSVDELNSYIESHKR